MVSPALNEINEIDCCSERPMGWNNEREPPANSSPMHGGLYIAEKPIFTRSRRTVKIRDMRHGDGIGDGVQATRLEEWLHMRMHSQTRRRNCSSEKTGVHFRRGLTQETAHHLELIQEPSDLRVWAASTWVCTATVPAIGYLRRTGRRPMFIQHWASSGFLA